MVQNEKVLVNNQIGKVDENSAQIALIETQKKDTEESIETLITDRERHKQNIKEIMANKQTATDKMAQQVGTDNHIAALTNLKLQLDQNCN